MQIERVYKQIDKCKLFSQSLILLYFYFCFARKAGFFLFVCRVHVAKSINVCGTRATKRSYDFNKRVKESLIYAHDHE